MRIVRLGLVLAIALSTVAFTNTAMAGKHGQKGANENAPGQVWKLEKGSEGSASPGQEWKARKNDPLRDPGSVCCPRDNNSNLSALLATPFLAGFRRQGSLAKECDRHPTRRSGGRVLLLL